jgi:hypothetical protein
MIGVMADGSRQRRRGTVDPERTRAPLRMRGVLMSLLVFFTLAALPGHALELSRLEGRDAVVLCAPRLVPEARKVMALYAVIKKGLEITFRWKVDFRPAIVLVGDHGAFLDMAGSPSFVAYAIPEKLAIVIDLTRMSGNPFTTEITLKHELCHLLLHRRMGNTDMPKWLDEGIAQWISEGIPELAATPGESLLTSAALSGSLLSLESLDRSFPRDGGRLALAYEESRSVVEYIVKNYGRDGILNLLESLRKGATLDDAVQVALMVTLPELEKSWQKEQLGLTALLAYLAVHLYTILFALAAVLTFWAYLRSLVRKRRMKDEPEDGDDPAPMGPSPR